MFLLIALKIYNKKKKRFNNIYLMVESTSSSSSNIVNNINNYANDGREFQFSFSSSFF